jgi:hypothetical protein
VEYEQLDGEPEGKLGIGFYSRCGPWRTMDVEVRALLLDHQSISQT